VRTLDCLLRRLVLVQQVLVTVLPQLVQLHLLNKLNRKINT
jgi:hypothetical protein